MKHLKLFKGLVIIGLLWSSVTLSPCFAQQEGIHFFKGTLKEAMNKAKEEKKPIFFDAYASWCGPCKHMDAEVYTRPDVGEFFNNNFVCIRVDMEKGEGPNLAKIFTSIDGYPSMIFVSNDGHVIKTLLGSRSGDALIGEAK